MFLSEASIKRPIAMSCLIIALSLLGFNAYRKMGLELMPKIDVPFITVTTVYPGASPEQIETDVAKRIEDQVVTIEGLKHVSSSCMENVCQTMLEFELDIDVDIAATDVREKLDLIKADFPEGVEDPKILKFDINAEPIIYLALTGQSPLDELYDYADNELRDKLTVISGVADAELIGGNIRQVHIVLDRDKLAAKGLSSLEVIMAVREGIKLIPSGRIQDRGIEYDVKVDADYYNISDIESLQIAGEDGQRCYVRDVGRAEMGTKEVRQKAFIDGKEAIYIKIIKKAEANAVKVVDEVKAAIEKHNQELPGGMELVWVSDGGTFIKATVRSAWSDIGQGVALTALILFFFLYNFRSTLIIAVTMPLTIIIGLFFMQFLGYTLNISTLLAIGMSVGILVTNSIVVMEAIVDRLNRTGDAKEAARLGAGKAAVAVMASAGTNVVVLFPIAMMGGKIGLFMRPLALTLLIMNVVSMFISFTLTPILCSVILRPRPEKKTILMRVEDGFNRFLNVIIESYRRLLTFNERYRLVAAVFVLAVISMLVYSLKLAKKVGFGFVPNSDQGQVYVKLEYPTRYALDLTVKRVNEAEERLKDLPELKHMLTAIGRVEGKIGQASEGVYLAQMLLKFSERTEREITLNKLMEITRQKFAGYPECIITVIQGAIVGGQSQDIELEISGPNLDELDRLALFAKSLADSDKSYLDTDTTVRTGKPELRILPNRAVLADLGFAATSLGTALRANIEGIECGTFKKGDRNYDIVVKFEKKEGKQQVEQFMFPGEAGKPLVLTSLGDVEERISPIQITRKNKQRISKLLANLVFGKSLGVAVDEFSRKLDDSGRLLPGYGYYFGGNAEMMDEAVGSFREAGIIAILLCYLVIAAILESFKQPWLILVTIPLGLIGVIVALALTGQTMSMFVLMGMVMMVGIVVNIAILIMDQFNVHVKEGVPIHKAMISAACERFRPIIMVTLAAILGMLPLAVGRGIGSEMRNDVGIASVGGLLVSGILTLIIMPILYDLFTRKNHQKKQ
ncbi:MAG: acriflavin resistance protein [Planctomycetes bacterium HGW-Planctomycetes-1]|nr:MAG: acriflavin resistance protein [Planctomycetes bacterium HGW-Planctomycetes-1]